MRGFARFLNLAVITAMLVTTALPVVRAQVSERMLVRLPKRVLRISWLGADIVLATYEGSINNIALINIATGEIKTLGTGQCLSPSPDRTRVAWIPGPRSVNDVAILDLLTQQQRKLTDELPASCVRWSPDGRRMAVITRVERGGRIVVISAETGRIEQDMRGGQRTVEASPDATYTDELHIDEPAWHPDAQRLAFSISAYKIRSFDLICIAGKCAVLIANRDYTRYDINRIEGFDLRDGRRSQILALTEDDRVPHDLAYSPDGRVLSFVSGAEIRAFDGTATRVVATGHSLAWAPDGRVLVFVSGAEIRAFNGTATRAVTSGHSPAWALDGRSILFARGYDCPPNAGGGAPLPCAGDDLYTVPID